MEQSIATAQIGAGEPWGMRKLVGQKALLRLRETRASRIRIQLAERTRERYYAAGAKR
jgi:hypothetical protein